MNRVTSTRLLRNIVNNVEEGMFMKYNAKAHRELPKRPFIFIRNRHMARVHSAARLLGGLFFFALALLQQLYDRLASQHLKG